MQVAEGVFAGLACSFDIVGLRSHKFLGIGVRALLDKSPIADCP